MERVTLRLPKALLEEANQLVEDGDYPNQSECLRSMFRRGLNNYHRETMRGRPDHHGGRPWPKV